MANSLPDLIRKVESLALAAGNSNRSVAQAGEALMFQRVFEQGKKETGAKIGSYSTKPTLVGSSSFLTKAGAAKVFGSKTKRSALEWVTLEDGRRLAVLSGGYKQIRDLDGLQTAFVDLLRSGDLSQDFQHEITQDGFVLGFAKTESIPKVIGNESRFGEIFSFTDEEIERLLNLYIDEVFRPFN